MSKALRKEITHRSKLENIYNKKKDICKLEKLKQTTEFLFHASSNVKDLSDNKLFLENN